MNLDKNYARLSPVEKVEYIQQLIYAYNLDSLDRLVRSDDDDADDVAIGDFAQINQPSIDDIILDIDRTDTINRFLSKLKPREQVVLSLRFGLYDGNRHTLEEVAKIFGLTRERVRQVERQAKLSLKKKFNNANIFHISDI